MSACSALFTGAGLSALQALVIRSILQWLRTDAVRTVLIMFPVTACYWLICKCLSFASCSLTKLIPLRLPESAAVLCSEYYWKIMVPVTSQPGFFPVPSPKSGCSGPQPGRLVAPVSLRIRLHSPVSHGQKALIQSYLQCIYTVMAIIKMLYLGRMKSGSVRAGLPGHNIFSQITYESNIHTKLDHINV